MNSVVAVIGVIIGAAGMARADPTEGADAAYKVCLVCDRLAPARRPVIGFVVRGDSKVTERTLGYLAHVSIGTPLGIEDIPELEEALLSSELFESAKVTFEETAGGVNLVATLSDKQSWIAAPTVYFLPGNRAFGVGFVENDLRGVDQKLLLYGQLGTQTSLFFGSFLDPAWRGSKLSWRLDVYAVQHHISEYLNPIGDPRNFDIARKTTETFLDAGALIGWAFRWWLVADFRFRGAYVYFRNPQDAAGAPTTSPETDGWDISVQTRVTLDHRTHRYGLTWGPYLQLMVESSVPGLDSYGYGVMLGRAYYSWKLFGEHELEIRGLFHAGYHLPIHEELTNGGVGDLRGYAVDQFRGDLRTVFRAEYSVPLVRWRIFAFRALAFYDTGTIGNHFRRTGGDRDYLPSERSSSGWWRNDVGGGLRIYVKNVVLPLLGLDFGYGIEGHSPEVYFEVGLTDF